MNRKTTFTHADGTVSSRNSKTRVYEWAVEFKTDNHLVAAYEAEQVEKRKAEAADFAVAVADGGFVSTSKSWSRGQTYVDFYVKHPETGENYWLGAEVRDADGEVKSPHQPFSRAEEVAKSAENRKNSIARAEERIAALLAGPQYTYGIARWSERRDSAEKAVGSFPWRHTTFRVVQAQEVPAKAPKRK
jgi:hypothetical protein